LKVSLTFKFLEKTQKSLQYHFSLLFNKARLWGDFDCSIIQNGAYWHARWAILACEMPHFAMQYGLN